MFIRLCLYVQLSSDDISECGTTGSIEFNCSVSIPDLHSPSRQLHLLGGPEAFAPSRRVQLRTAI